MATSLETPSRPVSTLAVHSVHEFVISVPDLGLAQRFYSSFGLDVRSEADGLALYTYGHPHRWARILPGHHKRLLWVSWGAFENDMPAFRDHLRTLDIHHIQPPVAADNPKGIWIQGPDGLTHQIVGAPKNSPDRKSARELPPESANHGRAPQRSQVHATQPRHLSHILLFSPDVDQGLAFYCTALGLRLTDRSDTIIAFIHTPHGSDHHLIALAKSDDYGLHHSSWDVPSVDAIGIGIQQMTDAGFPDGWGLGRHVLGSNYFRYVRDPWGSYAEYSYDIDYIPAGMIWPSGNYPPEDSLYVWGPELPADFVENYESRHRYR